MDSWFPTFQELFNRQILLPARWRRSATRAQQNSLLRLLAVAIETNVPLAALLEQWMQDETGSQRLRLAALVDLLKKGKPIAEAIELVPGLLEDEDALAVRFDAQMGTRTAAIRQLLSDLDWQAENRVYRLRGDLLYVAVVIVLGFLIVTFVQLKILPVFQRIFQEFGLSLPPVVRFSIEAARTVAHSWWLVALMVLIALICMFSTRTGRFVRNSILGRWLWPIRTLQAADVLQKLGIATALGRPIAGALSTLARYHFLPTIRQQLLFVRNEVEQGEDVWQSMTAAGLLNPTEHRLLRTAERLGNRSWILKQIAARKRRGTYWRLQRAGEFVLPALQVLLGLVVLLQTLTVFEPLVTLIEGLQ